MSNRLRTQEPPRRGSVFDAMVEPSITFENMHEDLATAFSCKSFGDAMAGIVSLRRTSMALRAASEADKADNADSLLREVAAIAIQCIWRRCAAKSYVAAKKEERKRKFHLGAKAELDEMRLVMAQGAVRRHQAQTLLEHKLREREAATGMNRISSKPSMNRVSSKPSMNRVSSNAAMAPSHAAAHEELGELAQNTAATWIQSQVRRRQKEKEREVRRGSPSPVASKVSSSSELKPPTDRAAQPRPTQRTKGAPMALTGFALGTLFWDASRMLLDPRQPNLQLWGVRLLHNVCMTKKKDIANRQPLRRSSKLTSIADAPSKASSAVAAVPKPPSQAAEGPVQWYPDMPFSLWVQGPLAPVPLPDEGAANTARFPAKAYPDERLRSALNLRPIGTTARRFPLKPVRMMAGDLQLPAISSPPTAFSLSPRKV